MQQSPLAYSQLIPPATHRGEGGFQTRVGRIYFERSDDWGRLAFTYDRKIDYLAVMLANARFWSERQINKEAARDHAERVHRPGNMFR